MLQEAGDSTPHRLVIHPGVQAPNSTNHQSGQIWAIYCWVVTHEISASERQSHFHDALLISSNSNNI
jgi:hypothetical protein